MQKKGGTFTLLSVEITKGQLRGKSLGTFQHFVMLHLHLDTMSFLPLCFVVQQVHLAHFSDAAAS